MTRVPEPSIGEDLVAWLRDTFPPRCVGAAETVIEAHRYAAQVELAQRLIRMSQRTSLGRMEAEL